MGPGTPAAAGAAAQAPKTPWRTPQPTFAELATPATAVPASGWQQHYDATTPPEGARDLFASVLWRGSALLLAC